ncbi:hypothetical protein B0H11DRAFT_2005143 [Mycena galericulata]|nr:hypothetical protein B0H11DRAFT_2005143 [Mycena galericulata]
MYPVLTLPNEIVSEIFTHFLPAYPHCPPVTGRRSPTILSHICRKWREIAVSTPVLWRSISIPPAQGRKNVASRFNLLETWLGRSGSCPLSLDMRSTEASEVAQFTQAIVVHCIRWQYLRLFIPQELLSSVKGEMPLLRDLRIGLIPDNEVSAPISVFHEAPQLRKLTLSSVIPPEVILPWVQLTRLITRNVSQNHCSKMLGYMPNLIYCKLELFGSNSGLKHQHLAYLQTLIVLEELGFYTGHHMTGFLASLTLPALRKLQIPESFLSPDPVDALVAFVSRSGCNLEDVCITGLKVSVSEYRRALPSVPTLVAEYQRDDDEDDSEANYNEDGDVADTVDEMDSESDT